MEKVIKKLLEAIKIMDEKCNNDCKKCPLRKEVFSDEYNDYDICDWLDKIKYINF